MLQSIYPKTTHIPKQRNDEKRLLDYFRANKKVSVNFSMKIESFSMK